ncbi:hypothetical protein LZT28_14900 [Aeromonas media]|uniref:Uncharacterized protein n=1 Tax=Aeromonas media TaxID=651 RepID=A0AAW5RQ21_AERME|nr:hypothetical protein [Aeromonas media]MCV3289521.1 hypothetical protein [Aeromonas media]
MAKPPKIPASELSTSGMIMEGLVTRVAADHFVMPKQPAKIGNTMPKTTTTEAVRPATPKPIDRSK